MLVRGSRQDDEIYALFYQHFPDLDVAILDEEAMKSKAGKELVRIRDENIALKSKIDTLVADHSKEVRRMQTELDSLNFKMSEMEREKVKLEVERSHSEQMSKLKEDCAKYKTIADIMTGQISVPGVGPARFQSPSPFSGFSPRQSSGHTSAAFTPGDSQI